MLINPIGIIHNDFKEKFGIPRQSLKVSHVLSYITFYPAYNHIQAFEGLAEFSHLWLIFDFSEAHDDKIHLKVRPPRLGGNVYKGVFATRSPFRPNHLGLSCVEFDHLDSHSSEIKLYVRGADLLDGTPIYDIKPYIPYVDCQKEAHGSYSDIHKDDYVVVHNTEKLSTISEETRLIIIDLLKEDPHPSYITDKTRIYGMVYQQYNVLFTVDQQDLYIQGFEVLNQNKKNN